MKTKLEMAHEYAMQHLKNSGGKITMHSLCLFAWEYADAMQAEADKRLKADVGNTDASEWQPDWSQAPEWANWYAVDEDGQGIWYNLEPSRDQSAVEWVIDFSSGSDFSYRISPDFNYQGDWRESLRKRSK